MIVDVHTHLWEQPQQLGEGTLERLATKKATEWDQRDASPVAFDQAMETVDHAIILGFESNYLQASIDIDQVHRYVARDPKKYIGFAGIDPLAKNYLETARRAMELNLKGVVISPAAQACHPTHSRALKLYEFCEQNQLPIMIHSGTHMARTAKMELSRPHLFDEVARTFPKLRLIFAQVGLPWIDETLLLISKHANFYADLSDVSARPWQLYNAILMAYQQGVLDHLLLGSDFPFTTPQQIIFNLFSINKMTQSTSLPTVPRAEIEAVVQRDSLYLLGITNQPTPPQTITDTDDDNDDETSDV